MNKIKIEKFWNMIVGATFIMMILLLSISGLLSIYKIAVLIDMLPYLWITSVCIVIFIITVALRK